MVISLLLHTIPCPPHLLFSVNYIAGIVSICDVVVVFIFTPPTHFHLRVSDLRGDKLLIRHVVNLL